MKAALLGQREMIINFGEEAARIPIQNTFHGPVIAMLYV